jgi:hypothetical protein
LGPYKASLVTSLRDSSARKRVAWSDLTVPAAMARIMNRDDPLWSAEQSIGS